MAKSKATQKAELREIISRFNPRPSAEQLREGAKPHVLANPLFTLLPYDPASEYHDFGQVSFAPTQRSVEEVAALLSIAYPRWREVIVAALATRPDLLNELENRILVDEQPLTLLLAHERIEDVAFVAAAFVVYMAESGRIPYEVLIERVHIVVSSIIRFVGAFDDTPAADILRMIGWVHFSFPRTESVKNAEFPRELVDASNRLVRLEVEEDPRRILALAGPGSVDKVLSLPAEWMERITSDRFAEEHRTVHIQPITRGTAEMMKGWVAPFATVMSGDGDFCEIDRLRWIASLADAHPIMLWMAARRSARAGVQTVYHEKISTFRQLVRQAEKWRQRRKEPRE